MHDVVCWVRPIIRHPTSLSGQIVDFMPSLVSIAQDARFIGQTVQAVLKAIGKPYDDHLFVDSTPGRLDAAAFLFDGEGWIYFHVAECVHQPTVNTERKWDIERFKKEVVASMEWEQD